MKNKGNILIEGLVSLTLFILLSAFVLELCRMAEYHATFLWKAFKWNRDYVYQISKRPPLEIRQKCEPQTGLWTYVKRRYPSYFGKPYSQERFQVTKRCFFPFS